MTSHLMTRKRRSTGVTPGSHLSNLKLLCALLSRKERRSGGKAGEKYAPPRHGGGLPEFSFSEMLGKRARAASLSGVMGIPIPLSLRNKRQSAINTEEEKAPALLSFISQWAGGRHHPSPDKWSTRSTAAGPWGTPKPPELERVTFHQRKKKN